MNELIRQQRVLEALSPLQFTLRGAPDSSGGREALGFFLSPSTVSGLETLELLALPRVPARRVLVVTGAPARKQAESLVDELAELGARPSAASIPMPRFSTGGRIRLAFPRLRSPRSWTGS